MLSNFREIRIKGAAAYGTVTDEDRLIFARPRDLQRRGAEEIAVPVLFIRQDTGAEESLGPGSPANLLPEAGGSGAGAASDRDNVCR